MRNKQSKGYIDQRGQSLIEYLILIAIVITVLLVVLGRGGIFERQYNAVIRQQGQDMVNAAIQLFR